MALIVAIVQLDVITTSSVSFTFDPFKSYGSFKWVNDLAMTEKNQIYGTVNEQLIAQTSTNTSRLLWNPHS